MRLIHKGRHDRHQVTSACDRENRLTTGVFDTFWWLYDRTSISRLIFYFQQGDLATLLLRMSIAGYVSVCVQLYCVGFHCFM
jgi:hypothetical protein